MEQVNNNQMQGRDEGLNGWQRTQIANVASLKSGDTITAESIDEYGTYACYGGNGLRGYTNTFTHQGRHVLIGRQGALCGNVTEVNDAFFASEHAIVATTRENVDPSFLAYQLQMMNLNQYSESSAQPGLSVDKITRLYVSMPKSKTEQQAIAAALSDVDALIASLEKLIEKKTLITNQLRRELIPTHTGNVKQNEYLSATVEELSDCLDHRRIPLNNAQRASMIGDIPYCGANGILGHVNQYIFDEDIILLAEDGGHFGEFETRPIAYQMSGKCWVNNHAHVLRAKDRILHNYIFQALVHKDIIKFLSSGTRAKLNKSELLKIEILVPKDVREANRASSILNDADEEIRRLRLKLSKAQKIKAGMMQELLTGKTRLL